MFNNTFYAHNFRKNPGACSCPKSPQLSGAVALDTSSLDGPTIYFSLSGTTYEGHKSTSILAADHMGCSCEVVTTLSNFDYG